MLEVISYVRVHCTQTADRAHRDLVCREIQLENHKIKYVDFYAPNPAILFFKVNKYLLNNQAKTELYHENIPLFLYVGITSV